MSKNRQRNKQRGAKSIAIRTKHKIGGRKSVHGTRQTATKELISIISRPRDKNKIMNELIHRGVVLSPSKGRQSLALLTP